MSFGDELLDELRLILEQFSTGNADRNFDPLPSLNKILINFQAQNVGITRIENNVISSVLQSFKVQVKSQVRVHAILQDILSSLCQKCPLDISRISLDEQYLLYKLKFAPKQNVHLMSGNNLLNDSISWISDTSRSYRSQCQFFALIVIFFILYESQRHYKEIIVVIDRKISEWLLGVSRFEGMNPLSKNRSRQDGSVLCSEIDGTPSQSFFTVLSMSKFYSDDQILNVFTFSLLRQWLISSNRVLNGSLEKTEPKDIMALQRQIMVGKGTEYCFRILEQYERKSKVSLNSDFLDVCLIESISLLNILCHVDESKIPAALNEIKRVYQRVTLTSSHPGLLIAILEFFVNHSSVVVHNPQPAYSLFFSEFLPYHCMDPSFAFSTTDFLSKNRDLLSQRTDIFTKYFPCILKILAWHPRTFLVEFTDIIPCFIAPTTVIEVFHSLVDLPCVTACMELDQISYMRNNTPQSMVPRDVAYSLSEYINPSNSLMYKFIMRTEGGQGDTIDKLHLVHSQLKEMKSQVRVSVSAQIVPLLLQSFFIAILSHRDKSLVQSLFPVILERSSLIYSTDESEPAVSWTLADCMREVLMEHPSLVVTEQSAILDYFSAVGILAHHQLLYSTMIWAVGEFCSYEYCDMCTPDLILLYYENIETTTYELSSNMTSASYELTPLSGNTLTTLLSCLSKLATRNHIIIARVILCISKVAQQQKTGRLPLDVKDIVSNRAQELSSLLTLPSFASAVLSPDRHVTSHRWHEDPLSETTILRTISRSPVSRTDV